MAGLYLDGVLQLCGCLGVLVIYVFIEIEEAQKRRMQMSVKKQKEEEEESKVESLRSQPDLYATHSKSMNSIVTKFENVLIQSP